MGGFTKGKAQQYRGHKAQIDKTEGFKREGPQNRGHKALKIEKRIR